GNVYSVQNHWQDALGSYQAALEIYKKIEQLMGQAEALSNIGLVYLKQDKVEEALKSYQAALEIDQRTGNVLGQAKTLINLSLVYAKKADTSAALEMLHQARSIYLNAGVSGAELKIVDEMIQRLKTPNRKLNTGVSLSA